MVKFCFLFFFSREDVLRQIVRCHAGCVYKISGGRLQRSEAESQVIALTMSSFELQCCFALGGGGVDNANWQIIWDGWINRI